jgi:DNA-binding NarL/FixJ family response regulator
LHGELFGFPSRMHRVLIVDDHPLYRQGLRRFVEAQPGLSCCGEADSCQTALDAATQLKPDLVILDLSLRREDGIELLRNLVACMPKVRALVLSQKDEAAHAEQALRAGALGYIMKEEATEELLTAIRTVLSGELYVSRRLAAVILKKFLRGAHGDGISDKLTDRELQVFQFIGSGLGTKEIATQLHLSVKTVETHRENIKHKLSLIDSPSLVKAAEHWVETTAR